MISIIITTYNRAHYLGEALESAMQQTYPDTEIIVIDDGSTDNTSQLISTLPKKVRYYYQENSGASAAKNIGLSYADGEYIAFLDSDDRWSHDKLDKQHKILKGDPNIDLVFCHSKQFISPELNADEARGLYCPDESMPAPVSTALLCKRNTFTKIGDFKADLKVGIEMDWHLRARSMNMNIKILPDVLFERRVHPGNSGYTHSEYRKQHADILKSHLDSIRNIKR